MKLNDEAVARSLGWTHKEPCSGKRCLWSPPPAPKGLNEPRKLPAFTTSLDAIVAEIEARELLPALMKWPSGKWTACLYKKSVRVSDDHWDKAAPLALCAALLAYLKEQPKGGTK